MPAQLTTKAQVNGYRFLLRRLDHALVRRDVRMLHDPMRSQARSLMVGAVIGLLVVAGAAIMAFLRPQGAIGDALIVVGKDSGALYVVVEREDGERRLHPVLNLASARLIAGSSESPHSVKDSKLAGEPRGPLLGIPGAPSALPGSAQGDRSDWTICDTVALSVTGSAASATGVQTTVVAGEPQLSERIRALGADEAVLVRRADRTYLLYDGKRAALDPGNSVMARALDLSGHRPRPVGAGLLDAAAAVPPLAAPDIPDAGKPGPGRLAEVPVGGVISVGGSGSGELYVVLADGVQRVSAFTAEVIRTADSQGMSQIKTMPPDVLAGIPLLNTLPVDHFPETAPRIVSAEDAPVSCLTWGKTDPTEDATAEGSADRATVRLLAGTRTPMPESALPVTLATSDGIGDRVDTAYLRPSSGEFVQVTGMEPGSPRRGSLFYVADNGIRYGIPDLATAAVLGLGEEPRLAPWAVIGQLVPGPTLSATDALVQHDALPTTR
ncbi:type VII secretion protein EccB [Nocardia farcinica]|uniref:Type VII secretion system protein eccB1 n=1 Tax=Nocardia farcinica TaxID=37329 RepID=A0A0H5P923_NOCFR|nr:type VII secretion protein EccB [Nocardia farcinica]AXK86403.1 type VII secretion protein EccB [Nocardia farcinica]CRY79051.1 Type VII secretion system protein eccB1 [Nocardia farcinica]SIT00074.1 type VII secretion protein EccB [Nocardia farcinica]